MRKSAFMAAAAALAVATLARGASVVAAEAPAAVAVGVMSDLVAVAPARTVVAGRVLTKDGVTPVAQAEVRMTGMVDGEPHVARSDRKGHFRLHLPAGPYTLQIVRRMEIYEAPSVYRVPADGRLDVDLLILRDFETASGDPDDPPPIAQGPEPPPAGPAVVGSVVDMVHARAARRHGRWMEALGFLGSLLAVGLVAH